MSNSEKTKLDKTIADTFPASDAPSSMKVDSPTRIEHAGAHGYVADLESDTSENEDYRRVVHTGAHLQLVLMSLAPGDETGLETHAEHDQFIRVEAGEGQLILSNQEYALGDGIAAIIPAGIQHNILNTSKDRALKLYTLYSPPEHAAGTVHHTKADEPEETDH